MTDKIPSNEKVNEAEADPYEDDYWEYADVKSPKNQLVIPKNELKSISFEHETAASWWKRGVALAIDVVWAMGLLIIALVIGEYVQKNSESSPFLALFGIIFLVVGLIYAPIYLLFKDYDDKRSGKSSTGKRAMGLRVIEVGTNRSPSQSTAFLREAYWIFFLFYVLLEVIGKAPIWLFVLWAGFLLIEITAVLYDPKGRRVGDRIAGTQVVEK